MSASSPPPTPFCKRTERGGGKKREATLANSFVRAVKASRREPRRSQPLFYNSRRRRGRRLSDQTARHGDRRGETVPRSVSEDTRCGALTVKCCSCRRRYLGHDIIVQTQDGHFKILLPRLCRPRKAQVRTRKILSLAVINHVTVALKQLLAPLLGRDKHLLPIPDRRFRFHLAPTCISTCLDSFVCSVLLHPPPPPSTAFQSRKFTALYLMSAL